MMSIHWVSAIVLCLFAGVGASVAGKAFAEYVIIPAIEGIRFNLAMRRHNRQEKK